MIEECNFKHKDDMGNIICVVGNINHKKGPFYYYECDGEENCILYQIYKGLNKSSDCLYYTPVSDISALDMINPDDVDFQVIKKDNLSDKLKKMAGKADRDEEEWV